MVVHGDEAGRLPSRAGRQAGGQEVEEDPV